VAGSVRPEEQGTVQGTLTSAISATAVLAPLVSGGLFAAFSGDGALVELPGAPFLAGSAFLVAALSIVVATLRRFPHAGRRAEPDAATLD
jgi:DHA1 family tetracycline resistance protein-like MFS transporter